MVISSPPPPAVSCLSALPGDDVTADTASGTEVRPPPEPPPQTLDLSSILDCLPEEDHAGFSTQFMQSASTALPCNDDRIDGRTYRLIIPQDCPPSPPPPRRSALVEYSVPLDKARPHKNDYVPQGSIMDPAIMVRPASPVTPFEFPFDMPTDTPRTICEESASHFLQMDSVTRVVGLPRVYGLKGNEGSYVKVMRAATPMDAIDNPSLMDGGANICITGILSLLVDVESIPPLPILVATTSGSVSLDDCCTKKGLIPLTLLDGSVYYQPCYYCKNATETIISPEAIVAASDTLVHWTQEGHRGNAPGSIRFSSDSGLYSFTLHLEKRDGLYYCPTDVFTVDAAPGDSHIPVIRCVAAPPPSVLPPRRTKRYVPVTLDNMTESEVWKLRLGSPGEQQLDLLPGNVTGIPPTFQYHPFRFIDWKEEARIQKQAAQRSAERTVECKRRFYMDFGFMRASTSNFSRPNKKDDCVVLSYNGFSSYLLIVDEASRFVWVFLTNSKAPPLDILDTFLSRFGHEKGGSIRTDQGGELARLFALSDLVLRSHKYVLEPTGADSPSTIISLLSGPAPFYTARVFRLSIGRLPSFIWYIYTTASSTLRRGKLRLKACLALSLISAILNSLARVFVSNRLENVGLSWMVMILKVSFLATLRRIKISCTWISTVVLLNAAITRSSMKLGTSRLRALRLHNSFMIWGSLMRSIALSIWFCLRMHLRPQTFGFQVQSSPSKYHGLHALPAPRSSTIVGRFLTGARCSHSLCNICLRSSRLNGWLAQRLPKHSL